MESISDLEDVGTHPHADFIRAVIDPEVSTVDNKTWATISDSQFKPLDTKAAEAMIKLIEKLFDGAKSASEPITDVKMAAVSLYVVAEGIQARLALPGTEKWNRQEIQTFKEKYWTLVQLIPRTSACDGIIACFLVMGVVLMMSATMLGCWLNQASAESAGCDVKKNQVTNWWRYINRFDPKKNVLALSPKSLLLGMVSSCMFGCIDNMGMFFGATALGDIFRLMFINVPLIGPFVADPSDNFIAGMGNAVSNVIAAFLATSIGRIVEDTSGLENAPMWSDALGMVLGCLIGALLPRMCLGGNKGKNVLEDQQKVLSSYTKNDSEYQTWFEKVTQVQALVNPPEALCQKPCFRAAPNFNRRCWAVLCCLPIVGCMIMNAVCSICNKWCSYPAGCTPSEEDEITYLQGQIDAENKKEPKDSAEIANLTAQLAKLRDNDECYAWAACSSFVGLAVVFLLLCTCSLW